MGIKRDGMHSIPKLGIGIKKSARDAFLYKPGWDHTNPLGMEGMG
jgi:hypothetical protein